MVNYKKIADEAGQYGNYEAAFAVMSAEESTSYGVLTSNNLREWAVMNSADYETIKTNGDVLTEMALKQINIDQSGLDLSKPAIAELVNGLPISQAGKDALFNAATITSKKWPGLKPGYIQNALQKRAAGIV